jgi:L-asparaginase II
VEYTRGGRLESVHLVFAAVVDGSKTLLSRGELSRPVFMRSCAKPFQSWTVVESGAVEQFGLVPAELAIMSGSHGGEPEQVRAAQSILRKAGLTPAALKCGIHPPTSPKALKALYRARREPDVLHNNCSGKHSGMVCATKHLGARLETYLDPSHPLQKRNLATIARFSGVPAAKIGLGTDGCSAPTFALPLRAMAQAMARFVEEEGSARRVREAMMAHPSMVGRPCVNLMSAAPGRLLAKGGAEGVYLLGLPGKGIGVAIKVEDGSARPWMPVLAAILPKLGLGKLADLAIRNHAGIEVGGVRVVL